MHPVGPGRGKAVTKGGVVGDVGVRASLTFPVSPVIWELSPNCTFTLRSRLESEREGKATPKEATNKRLSIPDFSFLKSALASAPGTFAEPLTPWPQGWWHLCPPWLPPDKGAGAPRDRLAGAQLRVKDQHTVGFCNCQSALMHQHRWLCHTTSPRERSKGLQDFTGCLPPGPPPAQPRPRGCLPGRERSRSLREPDCHLTSTFPAAPSLRQLRLCLPSQPQQWLLPGCTASLPNPPFAFTASLSRANLIAAQQLCRTASPPSRQRRCRRAGWGDGDPVRQRSGVPPGGGPDAPPRQPAVRQQAGRLLTRCLEASCSPEAPSLRAGRISCHSSARFSQG